MLKVRHIIFFFAGKTYKGAFRGVFRGGQDLSVAKGNLGGQKGQKCTLKEKIWKRGRRAKPNMTFAGGEIRLVMKSF
jgi:hypothetical protein